MYNKQGSEEGMRYNIGYECASIKGKFTIGGQGSEKAKATTDDGKAKAETQGRKDARTQRKAKAVREGKGGNARTQRKAKAVRKGKGDDGKGRKSRPFEPSGRRDARRSVWFFAFCVRGFSIDLCAG